MGIARYLHNDNCFPFVINKEEKKFTQWLWTWQFGAGLCVLALILVASVVVFSVNSDSDQDDPVQFIDRETWDAQPPSQKLDNLAEVPVPYVIISHTATEPCISQSKCVLRVRLIQTFHMESKGWSDIAYNFLVGGDGLAYVGRGWDAEGSHAHGWNDKSMGISFIGTFNNVTPSDKQLQVAAGVIKIGVKLGKILPSYKLLGHRQVSKTLSPGDKLYEILTTWDHWSSEPPVINSQSIHIESGNSG